jgi:guanylate kinase
MGILFIVSGPSGAGKGTILERVIDEDPAVKFSVSATTRRPRHGEIDGVHYFFVDHGRFEEMIENSELLEWAKVHHEYYGTLRKFVNDTMQDGFDVILDIDVQGAVQLMDRKEEGVFIFIAPPGREELGRRLKGRGTESDEQIRQRLEVASWELTFMNRYEYVIINDELTLAREKLIAIITAERCRTKYRTYEIK